MMIPWWRLRERGEAFVRTELVVGYLSQTSEPSDDPVIILIVGWMAHKRRASCHRCLTGLGTRVTMAVFRLKGERGEIIYDPLDPDAITMSLVRRGEERRARVFWDADIVGENRSSYEIEKGLGNGEVGHSTLIATMHRLLWRKVR